MPLQVLERSERNAFDTIYDPPAKKTSAIDRNTNNYLIQVLPLGAIGGSRGGARPARAPPFAWHPSSLADLGGARPAHTPPFAWHPSF